MCAIHLVCGNDEMYSSCLQCGQYKCFLLFFFLFPHIFFRYYFKMNSQNLKIEVPINSTLISFYIHPSSKHD